MKCRPKPMEPETNLKKTENAKGNRFTVESTKRLHFFMSFSRKKLSILSQKSTYQAKLISIQMEMRRKRVGKIR